MPKPALDFELAQATLLRMQKNYATVHLGSGRTICVESENHCVYVNSKLGHALGITEKEAQEKSARVQVISLDNDNSFSMTWVTIDNVRCIHRRSLKDIAASQLASEL